jgi:ribonuclease HII
MLKPAKPSLVVSRSTKQRKSALLPWNTPIAEKLAFDNEVLQALNTQRMRSVFASTDSLKTNPLRLIGVDEVGRGSLIGSVVAVAFQWREEALDNTIDLQQRLHFLTDSKQLTPLQRSVLAPELEALGYFGVGEASPTDIEELNLHQASLLASWRACQALAHHRNTPLCPQQDFILLDGRALLPQWPATQQKAIVKGDGLSALIAGASVLAKEHRDAWVRQQAKHYPHYDWHNNMGYPTVKHLAGLRQFGLTPLHRKHYKPCQEARYAHATAPSL